MKFVCVCGIATQTHTVPSHTHTPYKLSNEKRNKKEWNTKDVASFVFRSLLNWEKKIRE